MKVLSLAPAALILLLSMPSFADTPASPPGREAEMSRVSEPAPVAMRRKSKPLMATGIVLTSLGTLSSLVGVALFAMGDPAYDACVSSNATVISVGLDPIECNESDNTAAAIGFLVAGGGLIAAGIPLTVLGAQKVPDGAPTHAGLWLSPRVTPSGASLFFDGRF